MPSAVLTTHSTLLTSAGWIETSIAGAVIAIGVDRHGQLSLSEVNVLVSEETEAEHFLGTRAAFGAFHAETVLVDAAGKGRSVASICDTEEVQSLKWESCVHGGSLMRAECGAAHLWDSFLALALAGSKDTLVLRTFLPGSLGKARFVRLVRSQMERDCKSGFASVAKRLKSLLSTDIDLISADRSVYRLAMWLAMCRHAVGEGYSLSYDSIQHSCTVKVELGAKVGEVEPLRTAFLAGSANRSIVSWTDRTWNPISSGFIVDGRRA